MPDSTRTNPAAVLSGTALPLGAPAATAVVWCDRRTPEPRALLDGLIKANLHVVEVAGPFAAMAELSRLEHRRRQAVRYRIESPAGHHSVPPPAALILVDPVHLDGVADVIDAVERYAPSARCWWMSIEQPGRESQLHSLRLNNGQPLPWAPHQPATTQTHAQPQYPKPATRPEIVVTRTNGPTQHDPVVRAPLGGFGSGFLGLTADLPTRAPLHDSPRKPEPATPPLRLTKDPVQSSRADREPHPAPADRPHQLLSTEELRMLLE